MVSFVYEISRINTTDVYVGKSIHPEKRWKDHQKAALKGCKSHPHLYSAMRFYGNDAFSFSIVGTFETEDEAFETEKKLISEYRISKRNVYNISSGGRGGKQFSKAQKTNHSEIQKRWSSTPEARAKNSEAQNRYEVSQQKSETMEKRWQETKFRENWLQGLQSDSNRKKHSVLLSRRWANLESREKLIKGMNDPVFKQKQREQRKNEGNPRAKLNWERVRQIRMFANEGKTLLEIQALGFDDISLCTLNRVVKNKGWIE